jgi:membrane protein
MGARIERAREVAYLVYVEARAESLTFMAGSIAYHAFVSLLPFLVLVVVAVSAVGQERLVSGVTGVTEPFLTDAAQRVLSSALEDAAGSTGVSVVGLVTLLWGTLKIFRSVDVAFSDIYETQGRNPLTDQLVDGSVVFLSLALAVVAAAGSGRVSVSLGVGPFAGALATAALVAGLVVTFLPMYYLFPDADVTVREVLPGTVFAAVGWTALKYLFGIYTTLSSQTDTYGFVGAVLVIITWFYFSGLVLLLGAALNAVLSGRSEDVAGVEWDTTKAPDQVDWNQLVEALAELEDAAVEAEHLTVTAGDTTVRLPRPATLETDAEDADRPEQLGGWAGRAELSANWDTESLQSALDAIGREAGNAVTGGGGGPGGEDVSGGDGQGGDD